MGIRTPDLLHAIYRPGGRDGAWRGIPLPSWPAGTGMARDGSYRSQLQTRSLARGPYYSYI